jgi:hypothetical protein
VTPRRIALAGLVLLIAGVIIAVATAVVALRAAGLAVFGVGCVLLVAAAFFAVGQSEDHERRA